jgi:acyl-coenzyme A synthetase/AMP-(fatty) acid ligase/acyl carrier protein
VVALSEPHSGRSWSYADLAGIISALCSQWEMEHLPTIVVVHGDMSIDTVAVFLATQVSGRTAVMVDAANISELGRKVSSSQEVLQPGSLLNQLKWEPSSALPFRELQNSHAVGSAYLTSGSTGEPKLFGTPFEDFAQSTQAIPRDGETYSILNTRRPSTISYKLNIRRAIRGRGTFIAVDPSTMPPSTINAVLADQTVTELNFTCAMLRQLLPYFDGRWTQSIVGIGLAGDRTLASDLFLIAAKMPWVELRTVYGLTEYGRVSERLYVQSELATNIETPSCGTPVDTLSIRIVNDEGVVVPKGDNGNIEMRGMVDGFPGTFTDDGRLEFGVFSEDDWLATGDKGFLNDSDELVVLGRWQETVNIKGARLSLIDIEHELVATGLIVESLAAVYKDAKGNDAIGSVIVPVPGKVPTLSDIRLDMTTRVPFSMVPTRIVLVDRLPIFPNGKLNRMEASQLLQDVRLEEVQLELTQTEKVVRDIASRVLDIDFIAGDSDFFSLGADSISCLEILADLENAFGMLLDIRILIENPTVLLLAESIENGHRPTGRAVLLATPTEVTEAPIAYWVLPGANPFMAVKLAKALPSLTHRALLNLGALPGDVGGDEFDSMVDCLQGALENDVEGDPFIIVGFSSASYLANELAHRLESTGNAPVAMVILDPPIHEIPSGERFHNQMLANPFHLMLAREGRIACLDPVRADHALFALQLSAIHRHVPHNVSVPVLLVGNRTNAEGSRLVGSNPRNDVVIIDQPHMDFLRQPDQVALAIEDFLDRLTSEV